MRRIRVVPLVLLFVLASCGEKPADALEAVTLAAEKTSEVESARLSMHMTMGGPTGEIEMTADGAFELSASRGHMTMAMDSGQLPAGSPPIGDIEMVFDGLVMYIRYPEAIARQLPGGKPWARMDLQEIGKSQGVDLNALTQLGGGDPTQALHYLRGASDDIEVIGGEEVRGVSTTHYKATIDVDQILADAPADVRDAARASMEVLKSQLGTGTFPMDVWIDEQGIARRTSYDFQISSGPTAGSNISTTIELYDFGVAVDVKIPPRSQWFDMSKLIQRAGASAAP